MTRPNYAVARGVRLMCVAIVAGCTRAAAPPPAPPPVPADTVSRQDEMVMGTSIIMRESASRGQPDTGRFAEARRASQARAAGAARLTRSIRMTPDTIRLQVGERISFGQFSVVGLDSAGRPVAGFVPLYSVGNQDVARFDGPGLLGMSVGRTVLRASASSGTTARVVDPQAAAMSRVRSEIPVIVTEASSPLARVATDSVPRDLVLALLGGGSRSPVLRVGAAADGFPPELAAGWRVLGSSWWGSQRTSVFSAPYMSLAALDTLEARLAATGWTVPDIGGRQERGFVSSSSPFSQTNMRCRGTDQMQYNATSRRPNESQIVMTHNSATGMTACSRPVGTRLVYLDSLPVPLLRAPADVQLQTSGSGGGSDEWRSDARVVGSVSVADLAKHFADQIVAQGWTPVDSAKSLTLESRSYRRTASNRAWNGLFTVTSPSAGSTTDLLLVIRAVVR